MNDWIYTIDGKLDKISHGANLIKFTEHQRKELINWYDCNSGSSPVGDDVATLIKRTGLSAKQIKHFMEYRRKQDRKGWIFLSTKILDNQSEAVKVVISWSWKWWYKGRKFLNYIFVLIKISQFKEIWIFAPFTASLTPSSNYGKFKY